ncbi:hypothetical protein [Pseudoponticoccus marisrubri]|uniref:Uncharacterized protein n=1 Tax=Pseudoponticoccus marisrubri TaxID=1685382 RepID=A0A0W7WG68_9RHOB|nr:hypothetical protein [Pseudoponticoccus marisrubri]KUF09594.1 hypothetical protein AVJ23_17085 [Pseudoponticoccus marisrubri]
MTRAFLLFLLMVWGAAVAAQTAKVRSGEHGSFTRLVLDVPGETEWQVDVAEDRLLRLALSPGDWSFDLSDAFDRIDRSRVADLRASAGSSTLDIPLACDCVANSFRLGDRMLVIDIAPSDTVDTNADRSDALPTGLTADLTQVRVGQTPGIGPRRVAAPVTLFPVDMAGPSVTSSPAITNQATDIADSLARDVAAAATRGLLEPVGSPSRVTAQEPAEHRETTSGPVAETPGQSDIIERFSREAARLGLEVIEDGRISAGAQDCVPDEALRIADWAATDQTVSAVLAATGSAIFGEFDRINGAAVKRHARALLQFGFGAEARATLALDPDGPDETLLSLSYLVDLENDPANRFAGLTDCESAAALWALLDHDPTGSAVVNEAALIRALERLPRHLALHLGPALARKLIALGQVGLAGDMLRRLERMAGQRTDEIALGRAELALARGDAAEAEPILDDLIERPGPVTPDSVLARVDAAHDSGAALPDRVIELTDSYAKELKHTEAGPDHAEAHFKSLIANRDFAGAFDALDSSDTLPAARREELVNRAIPRLVGEAGDMEFLKVAMPVIRTGTLLDRAATKALSRRLLDIGLPDVAFDLLRRVPPSDTDRTVRLLIADALIDLSRPGEAETLLIGLTGDDVGLLRARARFEMEDYEYARAMYDQLGRSEQVSTAAWLAGEWPILIEREDPILAAAARLAESDSAINPEADITLTDISAAIDETSATRSVLEALLAQTDVEQSETEPVSSP